MPVFAVIATGEPSKVRARIAEKAAAGQYYPLTADVSFVSFDGTTQALSEMLGIRQGETGSGVVLLIENYSGRSNPNLWEWLKLHWKPTPS